MVIDILDGELDTMTAIYDKLQLFNTNAQKRMLAWLQSRLDDDAAERLERERTVAMETGRGDR